MYELILYLISFVFLFYLMYTQAYPLVKKYKNYKKEREELVKRYNRMWKARKDMLVKFMFNKFRCTLIGQ